MTKTAKRVMFQGTSSHVGKSILTTAFCRILAQDGYKTAPFKAQNMALNSYVTLSGGEIGRSTVAQAEAAGTLPIVQMNPVLLKPTGNSCSQVILLGESVGNYSASEYQNNYSQKAWDSVKTSLDYMESHFDAIVIEGAGSPAEVNLKKNDIVNMRIAKECRAPVFLIADIDRGGALASIVGTLELLDPDERELVKGLVINKFRGDITLLEPALTFLKEKTGIPVVGVIPYLDKLGIDDEDSVSLQDLPSDHVMRDIHIVVMQTPKISNFTDFDALNHEPDVNVRFVQQGDMIGDPDLILLPGSKNTTEDLLYLKRQGYAKEIQEMAAKGVPVIGICGGFQMLGEKVCDPLHVESNNDEVDGLGLLPYVTSMHGKKNTYQVTFDCSSLPFLDMEFSGKGLRGYEIHMGETTLVHPAQSLFHIVQRSLEPVDLKDGFINEAHNVFGTYCHGLFDNDELRRAVINALRRRKGLKDLPVQFKYRAYKEAEFDRLAKTVRKHFDMDKFYEILRNE
ncbi:cobyric acid synthase [Dialister sp.]|uniref:cobyric acid synthase n=1 Tax=Dialister sp. TaxID=1955814 RepID=UPI002E822E48|nr:cobyric acid synthase [Dialister sp.]MEE3452069.1 cobyric acid synthase [Dialister sp.]